MAYSKQNFQDGQILNAANLEAMENGIIAGQGAYNLLDNSDFTNPVNQRGKTSYSIDGNEYTIDRWKTQYGTGLTIENGYINIIGAWQIYQILKNPKDGVYTFAAEIRINSIGDNQPNIYISDGTEVLLDAPIGQWKTYILQYDLSSIESDNISFSLSSRGGNNSNASISARWAAMYKGSYDASTLPPYVPKGKHVEMLNCGVPLTPHNLLDNSDFRNPVNQRGATSYTASSYCIDRWFLGSGSASITSSGINLTGAVFRQAVALKAGTYTFAIHLSTGTTLFITFQYDGSSSVTSLGGESVTTGAYITMYNYDSGVVMVQFVQSNDSSGVHTTVWAALYEGSYTADTLPPYQPKGYAAELAECQRYYRQMSYPVIPCGNNPAGTQVYGFLPFRMRIANPTVSCDTLHFFKGDTTFCSVSSASAASYGAGTRIVFDLSQSVEGNLAGAVAGNGITISADL